MRTFFAALLLLLCSPGFGQVPGMFNPLLVGTIVGPAQVAFASHAVNSSAASSYTFSGQGIGTASSDRFVVVAACAYAGSGASSVSSITIGGNVATSLVSPALGSGAVGCSLYGLGVPSGTTATVVVNYSATVSRMGIGVWAATSLQSTVPVNTYNTSGTSNPLSVSINAPAGSIAIGASSMINTGSSGTYTWAGLGTKDYDEVISLAVTQTGAHSTFATTQTGLTVSATYTQTPNATGDLVVAVLQ